VSFKGSSFFQEKLYLASVCWCVIIKSFRSPCCIQTPSRLVSCTGGWVPLIAGKEILMVAASLVHCCTIKERYCFITVVRCCPCTVHSIERSPLELLQFIQKYSPGKLGNSVPNIVIMLRIFLTIAVSVATCERSFSKLKLFKNYLRQGFATFFCSWPTKLVRNGNVRL